MTASTFGLCLMAGAIWVGANNWQGFENPAPVEVAVVAQKDLTPTGTVAPTPAVDPERPNEISRTTTENGSTIIKVKPPSISDGEGSIIVRDPASITQTAMLAHIPLPELIEKSGDKRLPKIGADGTRPFDAYARTWSGTAGPRIAIVITGLGLSQTGTQTAIKQLPDEVTLAFASEGNSIDRWMQTARRKGHEIILQIPMEPFDYPNVSPGKFTLEVGASPQENRDRLEWALGRTTNYTGVMNYMGAAFTSDPAAVSALAGNLQTRGLMYLDDGTSARSVVQEATLKAGVPFAQADFIIDAERTNGAILAKLNELEQTA
ncbi:MAG: divergent polysaccharide deacetylase family protein, partial [Notoacmeibacter sp.]